MADDWDKVKRIFADAIKLSPELRLAYLNEACADDKKMRREVESLLASFNDAESFMEKLGAEEFADVIKGNSKSLQKGKCFAHYEIIKQIGAGGIGEVYLAKDKKLDRKVAIKILNEKFAKHESNLNRFFQEAKAASALNHPNILVIHEFGESNEAHYIVSEFIEGKTLRETLKENTLRLTEILDISIQIAGALSTAHEAHLVHRDIKPENIMIRPDGFVKILDFGLAKLIKQKMIGLEESTLQQNQTAKGVILGTVNYMSPEQAKGEQVDERTDIFSLGTVIYEMITGRSPFAGDSTSETLANLINIEPQPLARFAANVPDELQRIVSKMLRKNKDERYQTMKDVLTDLKDLRENLIFDERLERSAQSGEKPTEILHAKTGAANIQTTENRHGFLQKIQGHKLLATFALTVILIGAIASVYYFFYTGKTSLSTGGKKSLAVLPFVNASQDPNAEYLSDGITESIINNLSQISDLKVMSRNSAFRFKNNQTDTRNIASQLGVETLVTGDIKQIGDKLVINARLIDATDDTQIWGNQYVRTNTNIITAQNEIAQAVANNLRLKLTNSERQQLAKRYTDNAEAYQLYLKGRYHVLKLKPSETLRGISYYQQAIELDPNYALAYVGLAEGYRTLAISGEMSPTEFLPKAKAAANRAVEIDERLAEAHSNLATIISWYDWDWNEVEKQCKRALELDTNSAEAHQAYAQLLSNTGRHAEAHAELKRAIDLDPLNLRINAIEGEYLTRAGQADEALARLQKTFELEPNFWFAHMFASSAYIEKGMFAEAIAEARKAREFSEGANYPNAFLGYALAKSGKPAEARAVIEDLLHQSKERFVPPYYIALIYNGLGETDKTFEWLEKGYQQRDPKMTFLKVEPKWNNLRNEPRFIELMRRINFE